MATGRVDLDGNSINPITICMIGAGGFIGSHLSEKLMAETPHKVLAVNVYNDKIKNLLQSSAAGAPLSWADRIQFHRLNIKNDSRLEGLIKMADLTINLAALFTPADHNTRHLDTIYSNFVDALPGDPAYYVLTEDASPCIFGPIEKQRWSYACAKQLIEKLIYAEVAENGREFTIVRPFNWIGPRMDFIPGIDGPGEGVLRVLACFSNNFFRHQPLKLVDGGQSLSTFVHIKDAIEAVLLMIVHTENPAEASGHIFHLGNPNNEVTVRQLAEMMTQVYTKVSGELAIDAPTIEISSKEFYGEGYDDSDKRIPDMTIINQQLGWDPKTYLLESTLTNQHQTYSEAINKATYKVLALDVYNDKMHLLEPSTSGAALPWADHIQFNRLNIKNDSRLEGLIKMANLTINLAAICTPADYNTPRDTIYINFTDAFSMVRREEVKECADSKKGNSNLATFPRDAVECILSNLPAEALLRSRLISKDWNELIEESFLTNREVRSPSYRLIIGNSTRSTSISLCLMHELGVQERYWTPVPTSTDILMASGIEIPVSSSDGVVLITDHPYQPVPWAVLNPFTGDCCLLPRCPLQAETRVCIYSAGLGLDEVVGLFKIALLVQLYVTDGQWQTDCYVCDCASTTWRKVQEYEYERNKCFLSVMDCTPKIPAGTSIRGKIYWLSKLRLKVFLLDLSTERFGIPIPTPDPECDIGEVMASLGIMEGKLFLTYSRFADLFVGWVLNSTWEKLLTIRRNPTASLNFERL